MHDLLQFAPTETNRLLDQTKTPPVARESDWLNKPPPTASAAVKPPLKWAGGKRWLVPRLAPLWQQHRHRRYVEPFCGGLALPLALRPKQALLNDKNLHLVNFYQQLQQGLEVSLKYSNDRQTFYDHRDGFNELIKNDKSGTAKAAQLFYYLNRTCFNGLCRFNKRGEFNVPFGRYRTISYETDFSRYVELLRNWVFTSGDLQTVRVEPEDFVYADPPYDVEFTTYSAGGFSWDDQVRTAEWLRSHPGPVVVSNQATPRIIELYASLDFELRYLQGPRRISCTGDRSAAEEILAARNVILD